MKATHLTFDHEAEPDSSDADRRDGLVSLREARAVFDRAYLTRLLEAAGGNIARAAAIAEIHPKSFERLMRRRGVKRPTRSPRQAEDAGLSASS